MCEMDACELCGRQFGFVTSTVKRSYSRELERHGWDWVYRRRGETWLLVCRQCLAGYLDAEAVRAATRVPLPAPTPHVSR